MLEKLQFAKKTSLLFKREQIAFPAPQEVVSSQCTADRTVECIAIVGSLFTGMDNIPAQASEKLPLLIILQEQDE